MRLFPIEFTARTEVQVLQLRKTSLAFKNLPQTNRRYLDGRTVIVAIYAVFSECSKCGFPLSCVGKESEMGIEQVGQQMYDVGVRDVIGMTNAFK